MSLVFFAMTGQAKLANLYWQIWTGDQHEPGCSDYKPPTHRVDCQVYRYGQSVTCAMLHDENSCYYFPDSPSGAEWEITCEYDPTDASGYMTPLKTYVSNGLGKIHSMKLTCEDDVSDGLLSKGARSASGFQVGAAEQPHAHGNLGTSLVDEKANLDCLLGRGCSAPLGAAPEAPAPSGKNPHLVEYIVVPIVAALALAALCGAFYCACGKGKKKDLDDKGPFQATPNPAEEMNPIDEDDEKVHTFIKSDKEDNHVVVAMGNDPVLAMGNDPVEEKPKKKGFFGKVSIFGKKKKTTDEVELGAVGFQAKSGKIPDGDPDEVISEEPLTGSLKGPESGSDSKSSDEGPSWGDQPLVAKTCADAKDDEAGYPVLEETKPAAPSNNLF